MSHKYAWWGFVKSMIRQYPARLQELHARQSARITPNYSPGTRRGDVSRTTETLALASLGAPIDREIESVRRAIEHTKTLADADARLRLIELVYWEQSHTLRGACKELPISETTGQRWHAEFIYTVSMFHGLWEPEKNGVKNTKERAIMVPVDKAQGPLAGGESALAPKYASPEVHMRG